MRVLITGGAGFIGSNFIRYALDVRPEWQIVNFDLLTYAGNLANLEGIPENDKYRFLKGDVSNLDDVKKVFESGFEYVINFAAESHVDRSLYDPGLFIKTNILGTQLLLAQARQAGVQRFLQISTDEVYGSLGKDGLFCEDWPLKPNSPYSASKASADLMCRAYFETFGLPVIITRSSNNYGPYQFPEKLIPFFITKALNDEPLPLYGDGLNVRDWLYVEDNCAGIMAALEKGKPGECYNIGGGNEMTNLEITKFILQDLGKSEELIKFVKDRPGHDRRYALDISKAKSELGWRPVMDFREGLKKTIRWYLANEKWWRDILSGDYRGFYDIHYRERR
ncbi:MAG: dTDP-glucose 4,6-dehydratase [candidate division Zixibacteria bacterium]|nr:dTDP-glucose 4,6-dehydratase [candidate division Zixibacteria bacterium]